MVAEYEIILMTSSISWKLKYRSVFLEVPEISSVIYLLLNLFLKILEKS